MLIGIIFIVSLVVATMIVNASLQLFMKCLNLSAMFISTKTQITSIVVMALFIASFIMRLFGI